MALQACFISQSSAAGKGDPSACKTGVECCLIPVLGWAEGSSWGPWAGQQRWQTLIIGGSQRLNSRD